MERRDADVVVVGAGYAGVTAALEIQAAGLDVVVLEARDRVGGRIWSERRDTGLVVDRGGQWIGPGQDRMYALVDRFGLGVHSTRDVGIDLIEYGGSIRQSEADSPEIAASMDWFVSTFDALAATVDPANPGDAPDARRLDAMSVQVWFDQLDLHEHVRARITAGIRGVISSDLGGVSLLHALAYFQGAGGWSHVMGVTEGSQQDAIDEGAQEPVDRLAADLAGSLVLGAPVRRIRQVDPGVVVETDSVVVGAKRVIVAIPPTLAGRIDYDPFLPSHRDQMMQRWPQGLVVKIIVTYDRPFWREAGLSGQFSSLPGPVGWTGDVSPRDDGLGVLAMFVEGQVAVSFTRQDEATRRQQVLDHLGRAYGPNAAQPVDYVEQDWSAEPYSRGCYSGMPAPGVWSNFGQDLRVPIGRIHWAGTETATEWMGYMEGAILSGERAAAEVIAAI